MKLKFKNTDPSVIADVRIIRVTASSSITPDDEAVWQKMDTDGNEFGIRLAPKMEISCADAPNVVGLIEILGEDPITQLEIDGAVVGTFQDVDELSNLLNRYNDDNGTNMYAYQLHPWTST